MGGETQREARHSRAAHAASDERIWGRSPTTFPKWTRAIWTILKITEQARRRRCDADAGRSQFLVAPQEFPGALSRDPQELPQARDLRLAAGRPHYRLGGARAMSDKPQIAAGLDLGSASTRCLILLLEGRPPALRRPQRSSVRRMDQRPAGRSAGRDHLRACRSCREAEAKRAVSVDALVVGIGGVERGRVQ